MTTVFVDTSFYVAILNPHDPYRGWADAVAQEFRGRYVTTTAVLTEVANFIAAKPRRSQFEALLAAVNDSAEVELIHPSFDLWQRAVDLYCDRPDKQWSLTDCLSFIVMQDKRIPLALTTDHHFEQVGFEILLKP